MNEMQIFQNQEFGAIRTISNEQGEPMFCGKDVAEALGYKKPENAVAKHVDNEDKTSPYSDDQLAAEMKNAGFPIARRTVAKYRDRLHIPEKRSRKQKK